MLKTPARSFGNCVRQKVTGDCFSFSPLQDDVAGCFEYYADLAEKLDLEQDAPFEVPMEQFKCSTRKEPLGVVGLITPWYSDSHVKRTCWREIYDALGTSLHAQNADRCAERASLSIYRMPPVWPQPKALHLHN